MDKISSILSSSRSKVDMSKERPVRAGAPSYGQPVSPATQTFQKIQTEEELMGPRDAVTSRKLDSPDNMRHGEIIDKITLSFKRSPENPNQTETEDSTYSENVSIENSPVNESNGEEEGSLSLYA